jgi:hypothetical protein
MAADESHPRRKSSKEQRAEAADAGARALRKPCGWSDPDVELFVDLSAEHTVSANELAAIERLLGTDLDKFLKLELD